MMALNGVLFIDQLHHERSNIALTPINATWFAFATTLDEFSNAKQVA